MGEGGSPFDVYVSLGSVSSVGGKAEDKNIQIFNVICAFLASIRTPVFYCGFGCLVYYLLEGWSALETVYFLTVTSTTVGCGDFHPASTLASSIHFVSMPSLALRSCSMHFRRL